MAAKKHLEDKKSGKEEDTSTTRKMKRVDTWSVPNSIGLENDDTRAMHNHVKHLRDHERSGHKHHHHGRAKRSQYLVNVDPEEEDGDGNNARRKKIHKHLRC